MIQTNGIMALDHDHKPEHAEWLMGEIAPRVLSLDPSFVGELASLLHG